MYAIYKQYFKKIFICIKYKELTDNYYKSQNQLQQQLQLPLLSISSRYTASKDCQLTSR